MKSARPVPKASIIIPTIGGPRREALNKLLSEIEEQTFKDREILIIEGDTRQGRAINKAAAKAKGDILIILDDDACLGHAMVFNNMIEALEADKSIGMVGASTIAREDDSIFQKIALRQVPRRYYPVVDKVTESDMAHHPCCAIPKKVFEEVGGENEILVRGLDPELRFRIRKKGYKIVIAPHSWIYHPLPESIIGIFTLYFRYGKSSAFAYKINPGLVCEVGDMFDRVPSPEKTTLSYRVFRSIRRFLWNIVTFRIIALVYMAGYALGYIVGFSIYRKSGRQYGQGL